MNCIEFRQLRLADPRSVNEAADRHRNACRHCREFEKEIHRLDESLRTAMKIAVPEGFAAKVLLNQSLQSHPRRPTRWYWLSLAASFFLAVVVYQFQTDPAMGAEIITHLEEEAHQVHGRSGDISESEIRQVLFAVGGDIDTSLGKVTYASRCLMDGRLVAHFVVENGEDRYTVIVIPDGIDRQQSFRNGKWQGLITPHATGSLAVIASSGTPSAMHLSQAMNRYRHAIRKAS